MISLKANQEAIAHVHAIWRMIDDRDYRYCIEHDELLMIGSLLNDLELMLDEVFDDGRLKP